MVARVNMGKELRDDYTKSFSCRVLPYLWGRAVVLPVTQTILCGDVEGKLPFPPCPRVVGVSFRVKPHVFAVSKAFIGVTATDPVHCCSLRLPILSRITCVSRDRFPSLGERVSFLDCFVFFLCIVVHFYSFSVISSFLSVPS